MVRAWIFLPRAWLLHPPWLGVTAIPPPGTGPRWLHRMWHGAAALYLASNPTASPAAVASFLIAKSTKSVVTNPMGSPNRLLFIPYITTPILNAPSANALTNDNTPDLSWNNTYNADTFDVQIANTATFLSPLPEGSGVSGLSYTTSTLGDGKWYWRVRAQNRPRTQSLEREPLLHSGYGRA